MSSDSTHPVSVGEVVDNGHVLTISSLTETLQGYYSCTATNIRGTDVTVFGPPPPPLGVPEVDRDGDQFTISWSRPSSSNVIITGYNTCFLNVAIQNTDLFFFSSKNRSGQQTPTLIQPVEVPVSQSEANYTFQDLNDGAYEVTVTSTAGTVSGNETERASFIVPAVPGNKTESVVPGT